MVLADYRPNQLTNYLFELANRFSTFYENCPVLKAETPELLAQPPAAVRSDRESAAARIVAVGHRSGRANVIRSPPFSPRLRRGVSTMGIKTNSPNSPGGAGG